MVYDLIIKNGFVMTDNGLQKIDVFISNEKIVKLSKFNQEDESNDVIDAEEKLVLPGFIDPHVHLNDPGLTNSEDFHTGTCGAVAGGITTVLEHPLTDPLPDNLKDYNDKKAIGKSKAVTNFALFGACSSENEEEILKIIESGAVAFKTFLTYSPEIPSLDDGRLFDRMKFLADKNTILVIHCENNDIVEYYTNFIRKQGTTEAKDYPKGRPEIAEIEAVSRVCLFARKTGCKINIAHCTLKEAVDIVIENNKQGADITVETCPQYLMLDESMLNELGPFGICNPPLRTKQEVELLWDSLFSGDINWVCSDHATYTFEEKEIINNDIFSVPAGVTGIETTYQLLFSEGVNMRGMSLEKFVELSSTNAAKRFGIFPSKGHISENVDADLVILDPEYEWKIDQNKLKQMIKWSPYHGKKVKGKVLKTIVNGKLAYDGENVIALPGSGKYINKG